MAAEGFNARVMVVDADGEEHEIQQFRAISNNVDRNGDRIDFSSMDTTNFNCRCTIEWSHPEQREPISFQPITEAESLARANALKIPKEKLGIMGDKQKERRERLANVGHSLLAPIVKAAEEMKRATDAMGSIADVVDSHYRTKEQNMSKQMTESEVNETMMKLVDGMPADWEHQTWRHNGVTRSHSFHCTDAWLEIEVEPCGDVFVGRVWVDTHAVFAVTDDCPFELAQALQEPRNILLDAQQKLASIGGDNG